MTDVILPFVHGPIRLNAMTDMVIHEFTMTRERPVWLNHLRIYEAAPAITEPDAMAVLTDALRIGDLDSADLIIREYGVVGCWRPSTVIVRDLYSYVSANQLAEGVIAHSLWNADLHHGMQRGEVIRLALYNDEATTRFVRPIMICTEITDEEVRGEEPSRATLRKQVRDLQKAVKALGAFAMQTNEPLMKLLLERAKAGE